MSKEFKSIYTGKNLSEVSQFKVFKQNLDNIFGTDTETIDQKLKKIF
jgi:trans-2-enoyl-CoA reductase